MRIRSSALSGYTTLVLAVALQSVSFCQTDPVRVAIVGLVHGHVSGLLNALPKSDRAKLVAIVEPNSVLSQQYAVKFHLSPQLFYTDLEPMLNETHPDAVLVYTTIKDHRKVIEVAARHGVSSMVEKPLATTMKDALAISRVAADHHVNVLVNYETTWYSSNNEAFTEAQRGTLYKVVVHDGHQGPKEVGVGPEWLPWLTDPVQAGAGALFDFGCYGADLATVLMRGHAPISVTAVAQTDRPDEYTGVDDDATIILQYPRTQAVLMPSWDWPFGRKDMEIYGASGYVITVGANKVHTVQGPTGRIRDDAARPSARSSGFAQLSPCGSAWKGQPSWRPLFARYQPDRHADP